MKIAPNSRLASGGEPLPPKPGEPSCQIALEEREDLRGPLGWLLEGGLWPQLLSSKVLLGDVV
jgi:hypothetical protein